jgi:hypothetical protein
MFQVRNPEKEARALLFFRMLQTLELLFILLRSLKICNLIVTHQMILMRNLFMINLQISSFIYITLQKNSGGFLSFLLVSFLYRFLRWRWPLNGTEQACIDTGYLGHEHTQLSAIGKPLRPDDGLFLTWHFSMFNSIYNRLKRSSRRTLDPDKADLFIIPYDIGLDGYLDPTTCRNRRMCTIGMVGKLTKILDASKYFQRNQGSDHIILWSLGQVLTSPL